MEKIIILSGPGDCGKTSTLNEVINKLKNKGVVNELYRSIPRTKPVPDRTVVITIAQKKIIIITIGDAEKFVQREFRRVVGATTAGDNADAIKNGIDRLISFDCDIIICASRTAGSASRRFIESFAKNKEITPIVIGKKRELNAGKQHSENIKIADEIIRKI
ncbi:MAG: hypothetical protein LBN07_00530 [Christensenellaceae bacterium]|jgi:molybdopterin-guanine dinucleotide biosynthesis protein|nr:hypothetical protein [Christensenellaceae bacterium]